MLTVNLDPDAGTLHLQGELSCNSLLTLWADQQALFVDHQRIDVSKLVRVDSAGLAALVYFCHKYQVFLVGHTPQLQTLIALYDLTFIMDE